MLNQFWRKITLQFSEKKKNPKFGSKKKENSGSKSRVIGGGINQAQSRNDFNLKSSSSTNKPSPKSQTPRYYFVSSKKPGEVEVSKVFKPKAPELLKEKLTQGAKGSIPGRLFANIFGLNSKKTFKFGMPSLSDLTKNLGEFSFSKVFRGLKFYTLKWNIWQKFNQLVASFLILGVFLFIFYLSFLDSFFLISKYNIFFAKGSYLDQAELQEILENWRQSKLFGVLPYNQYWFLNDQNLTNSAKSVVPEVQKIEIQEKYWPNGVRLKLQTEEILLTLSVFENNQLRYWRITQAGKVLTEDKAGLREFLVQVQRPIVFNKSGVSFKDYDLQNNQTQLNRYWFARWLWNELDKLGIKIRQTYFPSIEDTDVLMVTSSGTTFKLDAGSLSNLNPDNLASESFSKELQLSRLKLFYSSTLAPEEKDGKLKYVDFRFPKRIFLCRRGAICDREG